MKLKRPNIKIQNFTNRTVSDIVTNREEIQLNFTDGSLLHIRTDQILMGELMQAEKGAAIVLAVHELGDRPTRWSRTGPEKQAEVQTSSGEKPLSKN